MERDTFTDQLVNVIPFKKAGLMSGFVLVYHNNVGHPSKAS